MLPEVRRRIALGVVVALIATAILAIEAPWRPHSSVPPPPTDIPDEYLRFRGAPDFKGATGWIHPPDDAAVDLVGLRGRVVLVDFWTYSCINCIRTFPYLRAWDEHYGEHGLTIVGVHTPEFRFERSKENVRDAMERYNLAYPVALDNDHDVWNAYHNVYWPSKYVVDRYGRIEYSHYGEGNYVETEDEIRRMLKEAGFDVPAERVEVKANEGSGSTTPELFAAGPRSAIGNPEGYRAGQNVTYTDPGSYESAKIYLAGSWRGDEDHVTANADGNRVFVRWRAAGANFVAGGVNQSWVRILLDNANVPAGSAGRDVRFEGGQSGVRIDAPRSYDFYGGASSEHVVTLIVARGFQLYTFAFSASKTT